MVDTQLISKTLSWFKDQENVTITLDIGTENCLPLLAVLFISQGQSKLADIVPVLSKKGVDLAKSCFKVCHIRGLLDIETLKMKTVGVTGDGAFCNGNTLFKNKMVELFQKDMKFCWDLLHLINRAHIEARGKIDKDDLDENLEVEVEPEGDIGDGLSEDSDEETSAVLIRELINFIQKKAKQYRHGLKFAKL